jgi:Flp pilus assembly protein TadD
MRKWLILLLIIACVGCGGRETVASLNNRGVEQGKAGNLDEAVKLFTRAIELEPGYSESYNNLGYAYVVKGDLENAVKHFKKAIEINPNYVQALQNLEAVTAQLNEMKKAKEDTGAGAASATGERPAEKAPAEEMDAVMMHRTGVELGRAGRLDEAIKLFTKAVELDPSYAEAYNSLGYAYHKKGDLERAAECFKKALEIDPNYAQARRNLDFVTTQLNEAAASAQEGKATAEGRGTGGDHEEEDIGRGR